MNKISKLNEVRCFLIYKFLFTSWFENQFIPPIHLTLNFHATKMEILV